MYYFRTIEPMLVRMDERTVRRTWKYALRKTTTLHPESELSAGEVLVFLTSTLLRSRGLIPPDGVEIIIEEIAEQVRSVGNMLDANRKIDKPEARKEKLPVLLLTVIDRTHCRMTGEETWLEIKTGKRGEKSALAPIEYDTLDLTALFFRSVRLLEERLRAEANRSKPADPPG